jgi:putative oxidoreductase
MRCRDFYLEFTALANHFRSFSLLFARVAIAYGFYNPALVKWSNFDTTVAWFVELGIPFASLAAFVTASVEVVAIVLLFLGLFTRFISIPLMFIMFVAIFTVHISNGFSVANNGFEIPLYYLLFLFIFATQGSGKFSLDYLLFSRGK